LALRDNSWRNRQSGFLLEFQEIYHENGEEQGAYSTAAAALQAVVSRQCGAIMPVAGMIDASAEAAAAIDTSEDEARRNGGPLVFWGRQ
jgi:hypothetical protein